MSTYYYNAGEQYTVQIVCVWEQAFIVAYACDTIHRNYATYET